MSTQVKELDEKTVLLNRIRQLELENENLKQILKDKERENFSLRGEVADRELVSC